jgi:hypothetical protein
MQVTNDCRKILGVQFGIPPYLSSRHDYLIVVYFVNRHAWHSWALVMPMRVNGRSGTRMGFSIFVAGSPRRSKPQSGRPLTYAAHRRPLIAITPYCVISLLI